MLSEEGHDPAQQVTSHNSRGLLNDEYALKHFLSKVDVATFESEFLNSELLSRLSQEADCRIYPPPELMGELQDRMSQKTLLNAHKIPTSEWLPVNSEDASLAAAEQLGYPLVFKKRRFGYDGYGTFIVKNAADLKTFCDDHLPNTDGFIVEKWVPFKRELACIFARGLKGDVVHYPLVESLQKNSRCFWVKGPIKHAKFAAWAAGFKKLLAKSGYVGVIGVELFDTPKGLLVNELAPRVHNTGHYTQDAFLTSQFELHIKALLEQPLEIPKPNAPGFAMVNLLGADPKVDTVAWELEPGIRVHWYGKQETRPGRKMGHINALGGSPEAALKIALKALKRFTV